MSKDQKEISDTESKKSSKIFLLVFLVAVTALAAIYFFMNDNEKVVENAIFGDLREEARLRPPENGKTELHQAKGGEIHG